MGEAWNVRFTLSSASQLSSFATNPQVIVMTKRVKGATLVELTTATSLQPEASTMSGDAIAWMIMIWKSVGRPTASLAGQFSSSTHEDMAWPPHDLLETLVQNGDAWWQE